MSCARLSHELLWNCLKFFLCYFVPELWKGQESVRALARQLENRLIMWYKVSLSLLWKSCFINFSSAGQRNFDRFVCPGKPQMGLERRQ